VLFYEYQDAIKSSSEEKVNKNLAKKGNY